MFKTISLKTKLLIPIFSLVAILLLFGTIGIVGEYKKIISLSTLHNKVVLSNYISDTLHSLQKERGLTSGYIADNSKFTKELSQQRTISDENIFRLAKYTDRLSCKECRQYTQLSISKVKEIYSIREEKDAKSISYDEILKR